MKNFGNPKLAERGRENWGFPRLPATSFAFGKIWGGEENRLLGERSEAKNVRNRGCLRSESEVTEHIKRYVLGKCQPKAGGGQATIGIPRALFYWKKPHFWETFFKSLGFKVLLSPVTNKEMIERGVKTADTETCFSMKAFYGHILFLEDKVDLIFLPRLKRDESGLEYCPKFFALPDQFSLLVKTPIISAWLDLKKENFKNILLKIAKDLGKEKEVAQTAIQKSLRVEREKKERVEKEYLKKINSQKKKIVLISHPYNLHDEYINLNIKKKIEDLGGEVIFIDEVPLNSRIFTNTVANPTNISDIRGQIVGNSRGINFHWEFGQEMLSQVRKIIQDSKSPAISSYSFEKEQAPKVSGAIEISAFQCGCDAVLKEFIEKEFKDNKIPFLYLLIDEQTGEAGLQTRLEAFFDTL